MCKGRVFKPLIHSQVNERSSKGLAGLSESLKMGDLFAVSFFISPQVGNGQLQTMILVTCLKERDKKAIAEKESGNTLRAAFLAVAVGTT